MRFSIQYDVHFESAHFLPNVPEGHRCRRLHGHNYRVTLELTGPLDPKLGWVRDFAEIEEAAQAVIQIVDHRLLNDIEGLENPTAEVIAAWLFKRLHKLLGELSSVTVWENERSNARVEGS